MRIATTPPRDPTWYPFVHHLRVRFAETDAMGVVHHAAYLPYLEEARVALLRSLGRPYPAVRAAGTDIAVVELHARYRAPLRFDDEVLVHARIVAVGRSTFQIAYLLTCGEETAATAVTVHACLDRATGRPQRVPAWVGEAAADSRDRPEAAPR